MTKEFNNLEEIEKYYNKETNTYVFNENGKYIDLVVFDFDLNVEANIKALDINAININACYIDAININACNIDAISINALDINALDIKASDIYARNINACDIDAMNINSMNIDACDIKAYDIKANDISYYAICVAYKDIRCKSIKGIRENAKHFVLDGVLEVLEND